MERRFARCVSTIARRGRPGNHRLRGDPRFAAADSPAIVRSGPRAGSHRSRRSYRCFSYRANRFLAARMRLRARTRHDFAGSECPLVCSRRARITIRNSGTATRDLCTVLHSGRSSCLRARSRFESPGLECGGRLSGRSGVSRILPRRRIRSSARASRTDRARCAKIFRCEISPHHWTKKKGTLRSGRS